MKIRKATDNDASAIVDVLKLSLGEENLPLTEEIWDFKHIRNPFGKSLVLVAEEQGQVIGVRAFMKWNWQLGQKSFSSFRAVDTATHPEFQGKGIFKKLTLEAIKIAKEDQNHFVFNTPNKNSRPGYLKMGWVSLGKIEVNLKLSNSFWKFNQPTREYSILKEISKQELNILCDNWNEKKESENHLFTPKSPDFLSWRYEKNPLQQYEVISKPDYYLVAYIKEQKLLRELRIVECICKDNGVTGTIEKEIRKLAYKFGAQFVSSSPGTLRGINYSGDVGPILTFRNLNLTEIEEKRLLGKVNWNYSLGDLELF